jgi:adenylate kinase
MFKQAFSRSPKLQFRWFSTTSSPPGRFSHKVASSLFYSFCSGTDNLKNPVLTRADVGRMFEVLKLATTPERLNEMIDKADLNKDGHIQLDEFLEAYDWFLKQGPALEDYRRVFNLLDRNGNGLLELDELTGLLSTTFDCLTCEEAIGIISNADSSGKGAINFEEFVSLLQKDPMLAWKLLTGFRVLFVIGGPGSGKGTACAEITKRFPDFVHLSSGDLLRDEVKSGSALGLKLKEIMNQGGLVEASTVLALLEKRLCSHPGTCVMLDGFPRSMQNARSFYELFGPAEGVLVFDCPDQVMIERILHRGKTSGRSDDNEATVKNRIRVFHEQSQAPLQFFQSVGLPIFRVDASKPVHDVVQNILHFPLFKK